MKNFKNEIMSDNWPRWTGVLKNQYIADASSLQLKRHSAVSLWHNGHLDSNPLVGVSDLNPGLDWTSLTGGNEATGHHWAGPVITAWGKIALSGAVTAILTLSFRGKWPQHCSIIFVIILLLRLTLFSLQTGGLMIYFHQKLFTLQFNWRKNSCGWCLYLIYFHW